MSVSEQFTDLSGLSLAADFNLRYPGEAITLIVRVYVAQDWTQARLQVTLPGELAYTTSHLTGGFDSEVPRIATSQGETYVIWDFEPGSRHYECQVEAIVNPINADSHFECNALFSALRAGGEQVHQAERVTITALAKGRYLRYLPAIYQDDELMGRFLMLFESFLAPIEGQIQNQEKYLDPLLAPPDFLPWLASWTGLVLDYQLPVERRRQLVKQMSALYKKRGTRWALQRFLEVFTGGTVEITEHYSRNFLLGNEAFLGPGVALGTRNIPNTFNVAIQLKPEIDGVEKDQNPDQGQILRRKIEAIIEAEKPAHTGYDLQITL